MAKASSFVFEDYKVESDKQTVRFNYTIVLENEDDISLSEQLKLPAPITTSSQLIENILSALHIGLGISYYKLFLPPQFEIKAPLSPSAAGFWNIVYLNGLAEFLYTNQLEPTRLAKFEGQAKAAPAVQDLKAGALLALGGGKDSIVAGELLKKLDLPLTAYVLGTGEHLGQTEGVAKDLGLELLNIQRQLDPGIFELNQREDTYNGHVPISMVFALAGLLLAAVTGKKYVVVGNEASASIPNTEWHNLTINHQWSKSFEFEQSLQDFIRTTISADMWYFSAIRPLSSVAVAKLFSKYPRYLSDFTSCNRVFLIDPARRPKGHWCGECAKCLSSFIILAPWLDQNQLTDIFSKNMLDDVSQTKLFLELTGLEGHKPLDCVGTEEEMILSLNLLVQQNKFTDTKLLQAAKERGLIRQDNWAKKLDDSLRLAPEQNYPPELADQLLATIKEALA